MNNTSIIIVCVVAGFALFLWLFVYLQGLKFKEKKPKKEKKETPAEIKQEEKPIQEEKPVAIGVIRQDDSKKNVNDFAPFRETPKETPKPEKSENKSISEQIKNLSPEMKAILMSDIIKPKF